MGMASTLAMLDVLDMLVIMVMEIKLMEAATKKPSTKLMELKTKPTKNLLSSFFLQ